MKGAQASLGVDAPADTKGRPTTELACCTEQQRCEAENSSPGPLRERNVGIWAAGGALTAAIFSSACCWLPLALIGFGVSAAGVAGVFEAYRVHFLAATALLLGTGFYFVYVRKPRCAPGDACAVPNPKVQRFNGIMLWVATAFVLGFAAFPSYVGYLVGASDGNAAAQSPQGTQLTRRYSITGMTCEGCSTHVKDAVENVPGVTFVEVSYENQTLRVGFDTNASASDAEVLAAIASLGYEADLMQRSE